MEKSTGLFMSQNLLCVVILSDKNIEKVFLERVKILSFFLPVTCKEDSFLQKER